MKKPSDFHWEFRCLLRVNHGGADYYFRLNRFNGFSLEVGIWRIRWNVNVWREHDRG